MNESEQVLNVWLYINKVFVKVETSATQ